MGVTDSYNYNNEDRTFFRRFGTSDREAPSRHLL